METQPASMPRLFSRATLIKSEMGIHSFSAVTPSCSLAIFLIFTKPPLANTHLSLYTITIPSYPSRPSCTSPPRHSPPPSIPMHTSFPSSFLSLTTIPISYSHAWNLTHPAAHHAHALLISIEAPKPPTYMHGNHACKAPSPLPPPTMVAVHQHRRQPLLPSQSDHLYFNHLQPSILRSRTLIKDLVNADHDDEISLVSNATTAAVIVLQQVAWTFAEGQFQRGNAVVMLHYTYGAVKKSIHAYVCHAGGQVIEAPLSFPVNSNEENVDEFRRAVMEMGAWACPWWRIWA